LNDQTRQDLQPALDYLTGAGLILQKVHDTQLGAIAAAGHLCAQSISRGGLVHLFGTGHSRMAVEEMFPRYGSFPGFHPIVELSLTNHTGVVGANGQRQAMFLERVEGFGEVILSNFTFGPDDVMMVFSTSGTNGVVVDVALGAKKRGMPVITVTSLEYSKLLKAGHSSGKKLIDIGDINIDNCAPIGDSMVQVRGVDVPVGPGSTIGNTAVVNCIKCLVAQELADLGQPPLVLASAYVMGAEASAQRFEDVYNDHRERTRRV
jgi:uncharacterized phosphosugar-binding protein